MLASALCCSNPDKSIPIIGANLTKISTNTSFGIRSPIKGIIVLIVATSTAIILCPTVGSDTPNIASASPHAFVAAVMI